VAGSESEEEIVEENSGWIRLTHPHDFVEPFLMSLFDSCVFKQHLRRPAALPRVFRHGCSTEDLG